MNLIRAIKIAWFRFERYNHALDFYRARRCGDWRGRRDANIKISRCDQRIYQLECDHPS